MSKFFDHKIKYRTLDQLISSISDDWPGYNAESLIDPSQLIKIVRKLNKQLGLRITKTKEVIVDFENWVVNLPDDSENINFAVICSHIKTVVSSGPPSRSVENVNVSCIPNGGCQKVFITDCGNGTFQIIERIIDNTAERIHRIDKRVEIKHSLYQVRMGEVAGVILSDNFLRMTVEHGKLYINYEGVLEDEEGNLLIIDHPMINDYYEYALKERILENMYFSGEDVERKLAFIAAKLQVSKREAYNVANMPEFKEIQEVNDLNRMAMHKRYFSIFI